MAGSPQAEAKGLSGQQAWGRREGAWIAGVGEAEMQEVRKLLC